MLCFEAGRFGPIARRRIRMTLLGSDQTVASIQIRPAEAKPRYALDKTFRFELQVTAS
jgi:hypothetical protein